MLRKTCFIGHDSGLRKCLGVEVRTTVGGAIDPAGLFWAMQAAAAAWGVAPGRTSNPIAGPAFSSSRVRAARAAEQEAVGC